MSQSTFTLDIRLRTDGERITEHGSVLAETPVLLSIKGEPLLELVFPPKYLEGLAISNSN